MYLTLVSIVFLTMCSPKMEKKNLSEKSPLQKTDYSKLNISAREIKDKRITRGAIMRKFTVVVKGLSASDSYKTMWYETLNGKTKPKFIKTGKEYTQVIGGANPGPSAVYGTKKITAIVEFPDGTKSKSIDVLTHKYLIKPGFDHSLKKRTLNE